MKSTLKTEIGILSSCYVAVSYLTFAPIVASIAESFPNVGLSLIQMVVTLPCLMFIVFSPLSGRLMQSFPKRTLILVSIALVFLSGMLLYAFHSSFYLILLGSAVMGCGSGLLMPTVNALICENFDDARRGAMMGLNATFVALGGLSFTFLSGQLARFGWNMSFLVFFIAVPVFLIAWFFLPRASEKQAAAAASAGGFELSPMVIALFVIGFIYFCLQNAFNTNASVYVDELSLGDAGMAGLVSMMSPLGGILGGILFGVLASRLGKQIETAALLFAGAGFLIAGFLPSLGAVLGGGLLVGIAYALFNAAGTLLLSRKLRPENNDFTVSVYLAFVNLGAALSPYVVNTASAFLGSAASAKFLFCGSLISLCGVISAVLWSREK